MLGSGLRMDIKANFGISYEDACPNTWQNQEVEAVKGRGLLLPWVACVFSISYGNSLRARETCKIIPEQCLTCISGVCLRVLSVPMHVFMSMSMLVCVLNPCMCSLVPSRSVWAAGSTALPAQPLCQQAGRQHLSPGDVWGEESALSGQGKHTCS